MLDGRVTDRVEQGALLHGVFNGAVHIASASWGPRDDGATVEGPSALAKAALVTGVTEVFGSLSAACCSCTRPTPAAPTSRHNVTIVFPTQR